MLQSDGKHQTFTDALLVSSSSSEAFTVTENETTILTYWACEG